MAAAEFLFQYFWLLCGEMTSSLVLGTFCLILYCFVVDAAPKWLSIHKCVGGIPQEVGSASLMQGNCWAKDLVFTELGPSGNNFKLVPNPKCSSRNQPPPKKQSTATSPPGAATEYDLKKCITIGADNVLVLVYDLKPNAGAYAFRNPTRKKELENSRYKTFLAHFFSSSLRAQYLSLLILTNIHFH
jgi:hypothetical protein